MDLTFLILFFIVVLLSVLAPMYKKSKTYHKNMFQTADITSLGSVASIEVFALDDEAFGPLVGLVISGADDDQRISLLRSDALLLAQMLETAAHAAMAAAPPGKA